MANIDFNQLFDTLKNGVKQIAADNFSDYLKSAVSDGEQIVEDLREQLIIWTKQLAAGEITKDDFAFLVAGGVELMKMVALKNAGLALVQADKLKNAVSSLIVNTATGLIPL